MVQGSAVIPVDTSAAAVALLQGDLDGKALPSAGAATYAELARPKAYVTFPGANHYGITDDNDPAGAQPDPNAPTVSTEQSIAETALWAGLFLRAHVQNDPVAAFILDELGDTVPGITVQTVD